jgi:hypothetical protein
MPDDSKPLIHKSCDGERLLRGARRISQFLFGTEDEWRSVYPLVGELPIFRLAGKLTARPSSLTKAISERERDVVAPHHGRLD